jgi:hypothetical protein
MVFFITKLEKYLNNKFIPLQRVIKMVETITIPKEEYLELKKKVAQFDETIDKEGLTQQELNEILKAHKEEGISEEEFLKKHPELSM